LPLHRHHRVRPLPRRPKAALRQAATKLLARSTPVVSHHFGGFLRHTACGLVAFRYRSEVRRVSVRASLHPPTEAGGKMITQSFSRRASHPSKNIPSQQLSRVTAFVPFLAFSLAAISCEMELSTERTRNTEHVETRSALPVPATMRLRVQCSHSDRCRPTCSHNPLTRGHLQGFAPLGSPYRPHSVARVSFGLSFHGLCSLPGSDSRRRAR